MEWIHIDGRNVPSTYQQVIKNMRYIQEEVLPVVTAVNDDLIPTVQDHTETLRDRVIPAVDAFNNVVAPAVDALGQWRNAVVDPAVEDLRHEVQPLLADHDNTLNTVVQPAVDAVNETLIPAVDKLNATIFNPDAGANSDVVLGEDGVLRVLGLRFAEVEDPTIKPPAPTMDAYGRNVTFRVCSAFDVGLAGRFGIHDDLVTLMTIIPNDPTASAWQIAIGDDLVNGTYAREKLSDTAWGDWERTVHIPFLNSVNPPTTDERDLGEYWMQSIDPPSTYHLQFVDDPNNYDYIDLNPDIVETLSFQTLNEAESYPVVSDQLNLFNLIGALSFTTAGDTDVVSYDFTEDSDGLFGLQAIDDHSDGLGAPITAAQVDLIDPPKFRFTAVGPVTEDETFFNSLDGEYFLQSVAATGDDGLVPLNWEAADVSLEMVSVGQ